VRDLLDDDLVDEGGDLPAVGGTGLDGTAVDDHPRREGAVGDVGGLHFDLEGDPACEDFSDRLVSIRRKELLAIPVRLGVAGGEGKVDAILGALRGGYLNVLVTDSVAARKILDRAKTI